MPTDAKQARARYVSTDADREARPRDTVLGPQVARGRTLQWTVERVPPTGQQRERIEDGLRLVFELLMRRYQRERGIVEETEIST